MLTPLEEAQTRELLTNGDKFIKTARNGKKQQRFVWCSKDLDTLCWSESKKSWRSTEIKTSTVTDVLEDDTHSCRFSIITPKRRIELEAGDESQCEQWVKALRSISSLKSPTTSSPFNVQHITHVDRNLEWTGNLSEVLVLEDLLGQGSFGSVYRARHRVSGVTMAVKMIVAENFTEIADEIEILKQCSHSNIVSYYGCWGPDKDGQLWILMDYCNGGDACGLVELSKNALPESLVQFILLCAVRALVYLHAKKIMHRDVKGGNILLTTNGDVKLADFGVSKQIQASMARPELAGSPLWMAPEVLKGRKASYNSDVWSLGITAIELAEREPPNANLTSYQVMKAIVQKDPPTLPRSKWSKEFCDFVKTCLVKDPESRASAVQLAMHPFLNNVHEQKAKNMLHAFLSRNRKPKRTRSSFGSRLGVMAQKVNKSVSAVLEGTKHLTKPDSSFDNDESVSESESFATFLVEDGDASAFDTTVIRNDPATDTKHNANPTPPPWATHLHSQHTPQNSDSFKHKLIEKETQKANKGGATANADAPQFNAFYVSVVAIVVVIGAWWAAR